MARAVVQGPWVRTFNRLHELADPGVFPSRLVRIALDEARRHLQRDHRWVPLAAGPPDDGHNDQGTEAEMVTLAGALPGPEQLLLAAAGGCPAMPGRRLVLGRMPAPGPRIAGAPRNRHRAHQGFRRHAAGAQWRLARILG